MRIGIDARFYGTFGKGLGRYTQKLITHLERIDTDNEYVIFLRRENWADYQPANPKFTKVLADYRWYSLAEQLCMPWAIWRQRVDLMHFAHFNVPLGYWGKFIVTIHDLILFSYPTERATTLGPIMYTFKQWAYLLTIRRALQRAQRVISVTEFTKREIQKFFNVPDNKISVIYEAADDPQPLTSNRAAILTKYRIKQPYLLHVGNAYPHKNLERLLAAFQGVRQLHPKYRLVLVGKEDYFFRRLKREAARLGLMESVLFPGFVTDTDLPYLYAEATAYVFPSLCEGFGLPALEACSYGTPVVASNNSSLPEVVGNAGLLFDPRSTEQLTQALREVIENEPLRRQLRQRGTQRVSQFSWERMAQATKKLYNALY